MKNKKKVIGALAALCLVIIVFGAIYFKFAEKPVAGEKKITVEVVHKDGSSKEFSYETDKEFLGEVLKEAGLVSGEEGQYGLFIETADGETASENQEWWCLTKNKEQVNTSADQTPIQDGEHYELTLTIGY